MKLNFLETHDRLEHFKKDQSLNIAQGASNCLLKNPYSLLLQQHSPYIYIFAHPRTADDGVSKRMIWDPRLTKPLPQTNSYLYRAQSHSDVMEICWHIPPRETWSQYQKGQMLEDTTVIWSVDKFINNREELSHPFPEDLSNERIKEILIKVCKDENYKKFLKQLASAEFLDV